MLLNSMHTNWRRLLWAGCWGIATLCLASAVFSSGCYQSNLNRDLPIGAGKADQTPQSDQVLAKVDEALDLTFEKRRLNLREHAAWQIVHGVLAFDRAFQVEDKN